MRECGDHAMLVAFSLDPHMFMVKDFPPVNTDKMLYLHACQQHRFALPIRLVSIGFRFVDFGIVCLGSA